MALRVVLTDPDIHPPTEEVHAAISGLNGRLEAKVCPTEAELRDFCADADAVLCARAVISRKIMPVMPHCRIIARIGTGYDNVDVKAAAEVGIPVTNVPEFCSNEVADHTLMLLLACRRKLPLLIDETRRGVWQPDAVMPAHKINGQTIGLVGFGRIGRAVAERALAFGMRVIFFDPFTPNSPSPRFEPCRTLKELLSRADVVSLHLPLNDQTRGLIGKSIFEQMKSTAVFINCARGAVVVEADLFQALQNGTIAAAGLDTLVEEPPKPNDPLLRLPNVVITPHCAAHTVESLADLRQQAYAEVFRALKGEPLLNVVNKADLKKVAR